MTEPKPAIRPPQGFEVAFCHRSDGTTNTSGTAEQQ